MHFTEAANRAFTFLERAGFRRTEAGSSRLKYESARSVAAVEWDARSGELNVFIGPYSPKEAARDAFSLTDVPAVEGVDVPERRMPFQIPDEGRLGPFLEKLAGDTQAHAQPGLAGDRMFFRRLNKFRSAQAQTYIHGMELRRVRTEADKAWQKRDFDKLIALYGSIEEDELTASEKAKLTYAKQHQSIH
jgi:hypothetical protein